MEFSKYAAVVLDIAVNKPLDYGIPHDQIPFVKRGMQVKVPVRGHLRIGYVVAIKEKSAFEKVLPLHTLISEEELITEDLFELAVWMGKYYCTPLRQVLKSILPASIRHNVSHKQQYFVMRAQTKETLRKECISLRNSHPAQGKVLDILLMTKKGILLTELLEKAEVSRSPVDTLEKRGLLSIDIVRIDRSPLVNEEYFKTKAKELNPDQKSAFDKIVAALLAKHFETHLLYGITGSGKTEVYLQAIEKGLEKGLGTIMLVPEISLTIQTIERFRSRFEGEIAILHHRLSQGERYDEWHRMRRGEARIAIGARSCLFSPIQNLGLIIVDEEHDGAYKQSEEPPCYHARDVAVMRGKMRQCVVILGTATPSLESYYNAQGGKYILSKLSVRATKATLPSVTIVDMRKEYEKAQGYTTFSAQLIDGIKRRLELGEQTILFLNRRGYHTSMCCQECGYIFKCSHCDFALTSPRGEQTLACHLCDYRLSPLPKTCPQCQNHETFKYRGVGTEQVERALHALFPEVRTLRADGDTTRHKGSHERLFRDFSTGKADVLIGTQMIAKGLHFPTVTLVSVLNSDGGLHIPDFRASERVFQLVTQVAGRAGRSHLPGEVIIQTQMPENSTIQVAAQQDYEGFYQTEIESRKIFGYPPFTHMVKLTFSGQDAHLTSQIGQHFRLKLAKCLNNFVIHPLVPSGYAKIKDFFRFQCLIRGASIYPINQATQQILTQTPLPKGVRLHIDVDPLSTFF